MLRRFFASCLLGLSLIAGISDVAESQTKRRQTSYDLAPQQPGVTDVYVVSLGLWGHQSVFESESKGAARVLEAQLAGKRHSVVLFNTKRKTNVTADSAMAAAGAIARVLDPNEDVAILSLTSHGGPHGIAATMGRETYVLTPDDVRVLLDETGARHRVLIVSACYSGIFAKALADPHTLVITAASADRPSFGCEDRATWTYFGDAFFNRALRNEPRLEVAFEQARALVTQREQQEGFDPSNPQIAGGSEVLARLSAR